MMTFAESIFEFADENGQLSWDFAAGIATSHGLLLEYLAEYGVFLVTKDRVDAGEFLVWLGY